MSDQLNYDAVLIVSFGGPESKEAVMPFLENVLRGRNVSRERMLAVADHYYHFGGRSPINQQVRDLIAALQAELQTNGPKLPIYWGNRNWHPFLPDTLRQMRQDGITRALCFCKPRRIVRIPDAANILRTLHALKAKSAPALHKSISCAPFSIILYLSPPLHGKSTEIAFFAVRSPGCPGECKDSYLQGAQHSPSPWPIPAIDVRPMA